MVRGVSRVSRLWRMGSVHLSLYLSALWWIVPLSHIAAANHTVAILQDHCQAGNFDSNLLQDSLENDITFIKICPPDSETLHGDIFENDDIDVFIGSLNFTFNSEMRKNAELHMKPYVTPYSSLPYSDNSQAFPFSANFVQMSTPLKEILGNFRWKHVVVITVYEEYWMEMGTSLFIGLSEAGFRPSIKYFRDHVPGYDVQDILDGVSTTQKAIVLCVDIGLTRRILQQADAARMATKHAFFLFSLSPYDTVTEDDYSALLNDTSEILESVFIIHPVFEAKLDNTIRDKRSIRDSVYPRGASASVSGSHERVHNVESGSDIHRQRLETEQSEQGDIIKRNVRSLGQRHVRSVGQGDVKRSLSTSSDEELRFYQDAASVIDRVFTIRAETETSDSSHLFQVLSNTTVSLMSGEQKITQLAEIHFEFHLYDFHDDESEFVKVQQIVYGSIARSTIKWPSDVQLSPDVCFLPDDCQTPPGLDALYILAIAISVLFVAGVATAVIIMVWRKVIHREMSKGHQKVILTNEDLVFLQRKDVQKGSKVLNGNIPEKPDLLKASEKPNRSLASLHEYEDLTDTARYNGDLVHVKELKVKGFEMKSKVFALLKQLREVRHENVNAFIGFYEDQQTPAIISDYCIRGSLADVLQNTDIKLDWDFKLSLLTDLIRGVRFVHNSTLRWHGNLKSRNCVIDSRWVLKVADYGLSSFYEATKLTPTFNDTDLLFTAPEHLRHPAPPLKGSEKGDVYSVALILQCVILRSEPYSTSGLTPKEILQKIRNPPPLLRPSVSHGAAPPQYIQIMKVCWSENPDLRPTIEEIYQQFKTITGGKKTNIVDTMFRMLEKYSTDLEDLVKERTTQLEEEKKKTDVLLYRMLPPTVADNLKIGTTVAAEQFPEVTIYFSDIVGFTTISAKSTPMQVVDLLNGLYTMFDATIDSYDVYKVETIGDAYMVSSGLPLRNGNRHAGEISTMALDLLSQCGDFTIKHMPEVPLRVRIGLHSGSCVAGVVGLTMPRYCLFGDTVNTASRMETTGAAYRIHISQEVKDILDVLGGYHLEYRGEVELKGKGLAKTYWLTGKIGFTKKLPDPPPLAGLSLDDFRLGRKISSSVPPSPSEFSGNSKTFNKSGIKNRKDIKSCETPDSPLVRAPREPKHEDTIISLPNAMTSEVPNAKSPPVLYPSVIQGNAVMADKIIEERVNGNATAQQIIHTVTIHSPREAGLTPFSGTTNDKPSHSKVSADGRRRKLPQPNKDAPSRTEAVLQNKKHKAKIGRGSSTVSPSSSPSRLSLSEDSSTSGRKSSSSYHENSSIKLAFEESLV